MASCAPKSLSSASSVDIGSALPRCLLLVCFSNRPSGSSTFRLSTSVDVAHGLTLPFGIGTKALPSWDFEDEVEQSLKRPCRWLIGRSKRMGKVLACSTSTIGEQAKLTASVIHLAGKWRN